MMFSVDLDYSYKTSGNAANHSFRRTEIKTDAAFDVGNVYSP